ncbi:hypothetical protein BW247_02130 [Acidihalobacter ferrooxydans]|uniref:AMP-dependent synthetase/ligase domain-containing protein n=2 Tax=Acidihalobacter ferrooxydans TaxID=1765967 RepID=A0A1P8UKX3_9GAMM|nr:hypothetical protein BW247_02130 [Acidihalobacter ferrooxydans]
MHLLPYMADANDPLLWYHGHAVSRGQFLHQAQALARALPEHARALNLSHDRYLFMLGFAALLLRGQTVLLPPSQAPQVIDEIADEYAAYCLLSDPKPDVRCALRHHVQIAPGTHAAEPGAPIDPRTEVVLFTSGTSGTAQANRKTWARLTAGIRLGMRHFGLDRTGHQLVATVPPQHMFGLEFSILYPLLGPCVVHSGRPFYPADIRAALAELDAARVLLTTPLHLRACTEAGLDWPPLAFVICSTAPLGGELAERAEIALGCPVYEIYGSTETGAVASRRPAAERLWTPLDGIRTDLGKHGLLRIDGPHLNAPQLMGDYAKVQPNGRFELRGRKRELINIAGKRTTLGDLNQRLLAIDGVEDGAFFVSEPGSRLAAAVVAPQLGTAQILQALGRGIDPAFLPRPLLKVDALPRNATGKLPRRALLDLLVRHKRR